MRIKKNFNKLKAGNKFEYYDGEKLKEAVVIKIISIGSRVTTLKLLTEGGTKEVTKPNVFSVFLEEVEDSKDTKKPSSRPAGTSIRGVCID